MDKKHPFGYIKDATVYAKGYLEVPDRPIGEVRTDEKNAYAYFEKRFEDIEGKIKQLEADIEKADNKGSYLMKVVHYKDKLKEYNALGDFESLISRLNELETKLNDEITQNRFNNLEAKKKILAAAKEIAQNEFDWKEATDKLLNLKQQWIETGKVPENQQDQLENAFFSIVDAFFKRKESFFLDKKNMIEGRIDEYEQILEKLRSLKTEMVESSLRSSLRQLNENWRNVGNIPAPNYKALNHLRKTIIADLQRASKTSPVNKRAKKPKRRRIVVDRRAIEDLQEIVTRLRGIAYESEIKDEAELEKLLQSGKDSLKKLSANSNLKTQYLEMSEIVGEKIFLQNLARQKYKGFQGLSKQKRIKVLRELLDKLVIRDLTELEKASNNMSNVNIKAESEKNIIEENLLKMKKKVDIKKKILEDLDQRLEE